MNVLELINKLREIPGHLEVFFDDKDREKPVSELKIEESVHPRGIKYLLLTEEKEVDNPPMTDLTATEKEIIDLRKKAYKKPKRIRGIKAKMNEEETQKIINHVKEGILNYSRIAETIGCSVSHVSRTAKKQGLRKKRR